jgi:hypothetical protein
MWLFGNVSAYKLWKQFKPHWESEKGEKEPSLFRALRRSFIGTFLKAFFLQLAYGLSLSSPFSFVNSLMGKSIC